MTKLMTPPTKSEQIAEWRCEFSPCKKYRYTLWRSWADDLFVNRTHEGYVQWIGLNPSTADDAQDDPTIRRCKAFTKSFGYNRMCMTNLFGYRATDPDEMMRQERAVGGDNLKWIVEVGRGAAIIIAAWGTKGDFRHQDKVVLSQLKHRVEKPVHCLRITDGGFPEHPLYLPKTLKPVPYTSRSQNKMPMQQSKG